MKALEVFKKWNNEIEGKIEALLGNGPEVEYDFRSFTPLPQRRAIASTK